MYLEFGTFCLPIAIPVWIHRQDFLKGPFIKLLLQKLLFSSNWATSRLLLKKQVIFLMKISVKVVPSVGKDHQE